MNRSYIDISIVVLKFLEDAEYHTITATALHVAKHFHLSATEINTTFKSHKSLTQEIPFYETMIYEQTIIAVSHLRKSKFLKDFPKTKGKGFFMITDKGLKLLKNPSTEIKKTLNSELSKYYQIIKSKH